MAILLAIECSQRAGSVALQDARGRVYGAQLSERGPRDDELLMPTIDRLVREAGVSPRDLDAVGVSIGPGGFTGLRISITTAKMLALTLDVKLIAVPTAHIVAEGIDPSGVQGGPILISLASKRSLTWVVRMARDGDAWRETAPGETLDAGALQLDGLRAIIGDRFLPPALRARAEQSGVPIIEPRFEASACLTIASRMLARGETIDARMLLPLYARAPEAVTLWEARGDKR